MPMAHLSGGLHASRSHESWGADPTGRIGMEVAGSMSETRFNDGPEVRV